MPDFPITANAETLSRRELTGVLQAMIRHAEMWGRDLTSAEAEEFDRIKAIRDATPLILNSKAELVEVLREAGLSKNAAAAIAANGWTGIAEEDEDDLAAAIMASAALISSKENVK